MISVQRDRRTATVACWLVAAIVGMTMFVPPASAQSTGQSKLTGKQRAAIVDSIALAVESTYVFPDKGKAMADLIRENLKLNAYDTISTLDNFAMKLTTDLRSVTNDRHIGVRPIGPDAPSMRPNDTLSDQMKQEQLAWEKKRNFAFEKVEILDGNIGYVNMRNFVDAAIAGPTAIAAMNFLAHTNAVIFDLRQNGGGEPSMCQLLMSYFLEKPTHINSFYERPTDSMREFWTYAEVQGPRMTNTPVYIVTSKFTFSCAEEFAYNFQSLKRGTIIGETTGGGAHPVATWAFPDLQVSINVPFGRAINPYTRTNWEGVGVKPEIEATADKALGVAHLKALEDAVARAADDSEKRVLAWTIEDVKSQNEPVSLGESQLVEFSGIYGPRTISVTGGVLQSQRGTNPPITLRPMGNDLFRTDFPDLRMKFVRDGFGKVAEVQLISRDEGVYDSAPKQPN